jgi:type IV secretion system protein VirD4
MGRGMFPAKIYIGQIVVVFAIVVTSTWGATQWAAHALGYQEGLGSPWLALAGYPLYLPWRLFEWWFAYDAYAPGIFERAGAISAGRGVAGALFAVVNSVWRARQNQLVTTCGSARWALPKEIANAGLFRPKGVFLGRFDDNYLRHDGPEHVMCFAPTRSGKGVGLVLPTLLAWTSSAVVHDIKGENWHLTAGWRSRFSHCLLFDPTDVRSARYNPLLEVRKSAAEVRDVQNIADILVDPEGALERRTHWEKTSHALLVGVILHVLYAEEQKTLTRVTEILADPAQSFEKTLRIMMATNHLGTLEAPKVHPVVAATARELLNKSENERSGVLSTAVSFLGLHRDPTIGRNTETCDWRIADLVAAANPVTLYLVVPPSDISRTKPLIRLILNQIGRRLTETLNANGERKQRQLLMILDEFPALGRLDTPLRWSGALVLGLAVVRALVVPQPDVLISSDGRSVAVRGRDGHLHLMQTGKDVFLIKEWLAADADARVPGDPTLASGVSCDDQGCVAALADGALVTHANSAEALSDDCERATLIISARQAPRDCAAAVIDRNRLRRQGALTLRRRADDFDVEAVKPRGFDRPWAPASGEEAGDAALHPRYDLTRTSFFRIDKAMSSLLFVASAGRFTGYDPG